MKKSPRKSVKRAAPAPAKVKVNVFPIVGVGASAGGLEAFTALLKALPPDTGMAFVLIQHLEAKHESMLASLLSKVTQMPVTEVRQGTHVQPNRVYVIPPDAGLGLVRGDLRILRRKLGLHLPIDHFLETLAETQGPRAIGVVLSGTASDGTLGLGAIKAGGGITFAQEPASAKFDGMPQSAISSGCVDFVLTPERIAKELSRIALHPYIRASANAEQDTGKDTDHAGAPLAAPDEEWARILRLIRETSGLDFTYYKKTTISRRVARRMALRKVEQLSDYRKFLQQNREELGELYEDLLIHVTSFFREPEVFRALRNRIIPQLLARKPVPDSIRIWVPGCSTGEEAYSIAICLLEKLGDLTAPPRIQIFASDVSEQALEKARNGVYPKEALKQLSRERLHRFFDSVNGKFQIKPSVRELCIFARHDLTKDPPFSRMDLISCRNVLIYLEPILQKRILASFFYALRDGAYLLLGKSETSSALADFQVVDRKNKFLAKEAITTAAPTRLTGPEKPAHRADGSFTHAPSFDLEKDADRIIWERANYAGLVVDSELQILHFRGDTSPYLRPVPGKATFQLLKMVREELVLELRGAVNKARKTGASVRREAVRVRNGGKLHLVNVEVRILPARRAGERYFLILFEEPTPSGEPQAKRAPRPARGQDEDQELVEARGELSRTREYIQSIIQEHETTNEELKAASEEAQSSMEELHSTNEELETAKEELQSTNEELITLNEQLQKRNWELGHLSNELSNVLSDVDIPIVILGADRRIRRFTPPAEKLLHLLPGDVGRPLSHIRLGVNLPDLDDSILQVARGSGDVWREVQAEDGRWYSVRILPFLTAERKTDGVLITFVDVDDLRQSRETSLREQKLIMAILNAAVDLLVIVLDREGRILQFNRTAEEVTGYSLDDVKGSRLWDRLPVPEERGLVKARFEEMLRGGAVLGETHWLTKGGQTRLIAWSNTIAQRSDGAVDYVIRTGVDVTEREAAQRQAQESDVALHTLLEAVPSAVLALDTQGRIALVNAATEKMFGYRREEMVGQPIAMLIPERFRQQHGGHVSGFFRKPSMRPMGAGLDLVALRRDGSEFPIDISLSYFETTEGVLGISFVSDITEQKDNQRELQALTARLLGIQEGGNKELSRELHDGLSQKIAALGMEVSMLLQRPDQAPGALPDRVRELSERINDLSADVHAMSRRLHPAILTELGLEAAVREECVGFSAQERVPAHFASESVPPSLPEDISLCLYRVAQESLRNVAKHARAAQVRVLLSGRKNGITLRVEDTGNGFHIDEVQGKGGLGLISMEERARLVNGKYTVLSQPGKGTAVELFVPLPVPRERIET